jgi:hypothetical protein
MRKLDGPKRIVLSRKGFDSGTGCIPSPILSDGTMLSLPIPDAAGTVSYGDLALRGHSYGKIISDLKAKRSGKKETKRLAASDRAHLDPDLIREVRERQSEWRPAYGQCGKDATILQKHGVGKGDLFIFFGWFRRCELTGGTYRFLPGEPHLHVVFGYLRVGEVIRISSDPVPEWAKDHPHLHGTARKIDSGNTLFVAADLLSLPGAMDLPGAAAFPKFTERLRLTAPRMSRSYWLLPKWFYPKPGVPPLSSHERSDRWRLQGDTCLLQSVARGQEFVLDVERYPEALDWAAKLVRHGIGTNLLQGRQ